MAAHGQVRVPVEAVLDGFGIPKAQIASLLAILKERQRQDRLLVEGSLAWPASDPTVDDARKLAALAREVGAVAQSIGEFDRLEAVAPLRQLLEIRRVQRDVLISAAAICVAWTEVINAELAEFGLNEETTDG